MKKIKAFVVEDEGIIVMLLKFLLEKTNFEFLGHASSAQETFNELQNIEPDVIFMDIFIKGELNGIELTKELKTKKDYKIIYITANTDEKTKTEALASNPFDYIQKPVSIETMRAIYSKITNNKEEE